jgi:hypothetical protein
MIRQREDVVDAPSKVPPKRTSHLTYGLYFFNIEDGKLHEHRI